MNPTETFPHRCIGPSDDAHTFNWYCRCGKLPAEYTYEVATGTWGEDCPAALREALSAVRAELAEAEATIANERGEGEAPCEGWCARVRGGEVRWVLRSARPGRTLDVVRQAGEVPGTVRCHWWDREIDKDGDVTHTYAEGHEPTFRAAMRAATAAVRGGSL